MNLEDVSREIRPPQGDTCCPIPLTCNVYDRQSHRDQKEHGGYQRLGEGMGGLLFSEYRVSVLQDEKSSVDGWW